MELFLFATLLALVLLLGRVWFSGSTAPMGRCAPQGPASSVGTKPRFASLSARVPSRVLHKRYPGTRRGGQSDGKMISTARNVWESIDWSARISTYEGGIMHPVVVLPQVSSRISCRAAKRPAICAYWQASNENINAL